MFEGAVGEACTYQESQMVEEEILVGEGTLVVVVLAGSAWGWSLLDLRRCTRR